MITHPIRAARFFNASAFAFAGFALAACGSDSKKVDSALANAPAPAAPPPQVTVVRFTKAQFDGLRWMIGDWRAQLPNGRPLYQTFRMVDDSTMQMGSVTDSTFKTKTDSAFIAFRGGRIINRGDGSPWLATRVDTAGVSFASLRDSTNHFEWKRVSANKWTANMFKPNDRGVEQKTIFQLERVKRK